MVNLGAMIKDADFAAGLLRQKPFNVLIQVTNRCNMKCSFCDFWPNAAPKHDELTTAQYRQLARELDDLGCFLISIEGGEPMVRPDLVEIVRALGKKHLPQLFTNGWYIDRDNAQALFDANLTHASVSIDYPDAARHDAKRRLDGAFDRAWRAVDHLMKAAPRGGKQVHVMTVLMEDNWRDLEPLLKQSRARGVGHQITLLSTRGFRRGKGPDRLPEAGLSAAMPSLSQTMIDLWERYPHLGFFREYFEKLDDFLGGGPMPTCTAGVQSFNIDHVGNVSSCIERIDHSFGNVKHEPLGRIHARMAKERDEISRCQNCWTACRGMSQALSGRGGVRAWYDLATRMRSS
jgi:radical SAM protein with 4Fe4S-binding SPASM domain